MKTMVRAITGRTRGTAAYYREKNGYYLRVTSLQRREKRRGEEEPRANFEVSSLAQWERQKGNNEREKPRRQWIKTPGGVAAAAVAAAAAATTALPEEAETGETAPPVGAKPVMASWPPHQPRIHIWIFKHFVPVAGWYQLHTRARTHTHTDIHTHTHTHTHAQWQVCTRALIVWFTLSQSGKISGEFLTDRVAQKNRWKFRDRIPG